MKKKELIRIILEGGRLDGGSGIRVDSGPAHHLKRGVTRQPWLAPVPCASFALHDPGGVAGPDAAYEVSRATEKLSLVARHQLISKQASQSAAYGGGRPASRLPTLRAEDLSAALGGAVQEIRAGRHAGLRAGLQIVGCHITSSGGRGLELVGGTYPLALSLIGCLFDDAVVLRDGAWSSVDLSGSAMPGLDASGLRTHGHLHLRRVTLISPSTVAGATVGGEFDASDMLAVPLSETYCASIPVDPDRGMLDMTRLTVESEFYLNRARIWGGLSLRGAVVHRSVFMSGTILASPLALLENWRGDISKRDPGSTLADAEISKRATAISRLLHGDDGEQSLETFELADCHLSQPFKDLLRHSIRTRTHSVRADGIRVGSSFFGDMLVSAGRFRMNYAEIGGSIRLPGAWMRSSDAVKLAMMPEVEPKTGRTDRLAQQENLEKEAKLSYTELQDYALDLRHSVIGGDLTTVGGGNIDARLYQELGNPEARFEGVVALSSTTIEGSLILRGSRFQWLPGSTKPGSVWPRQCGVNFSFTLADCRALDKAHVAEMATDRPRGKPVAHRMPMREMGLAQYGLDLDQATIGDDIDLRDTRCLWGLRLQNAKVTGSLILHDHLRQEDDPARPAPAYGVRGRLNLRGVEIEGGAHLVFSARTGPEIDATHARINGHLELMSALDPIPLIGPAEQAELEGLRLRAEIQRNLPARQGEVPAQPGSGVDHSNKDPWAIIFTSASATKFTHTRVAWPDPGGLHLEGFRYQATGDNGPLLQRERPRAVDRSALWRIGALVAARIVLFGGVSLFAMGVLLVPPLQSSAAIAEFFLSISDLVLLWLLLVVAMVLWIAGRTIEPRKETYLLRGKEKKVILRGLDVLAVEYLNLQKDLPNRYRLRPSTYVPLEPYEVAATAMREGGRYISANLVEIARLRRRRDMLSIRLHGPMKLMMMAVDVTSNFGLNVSRLLNIVLLSVVVASGVGFGLARQGHLVSATEATSEAYFCPLSGSPELDLSECPRVAYGLDLLTPMVDFGEAKRWSPNPQKPLGNITGMTRMLLNLLQLWGAVLSLLIVASVFWRAEAVLSRTRD